MKRRPTWETMLADKERDKAANAPKEEKKDHC